MKPSRDIQPVTEFRANAAQIIEQVQATGEPVILTHAAVAKKLRARLAR